jgi:selenocysteine lyase/cysteine desulfurase
MENINAHETKLTTMLRDGLRDIDGVTIYCQDDLTNHISILPANVDGMDSLNVGTILDVDYNIACRTGLHCAPLVHDQLGTTEIHGAFRFGIGPFNTEEHIKTTIEAVKEIAISRKK